LLSDDQETVVRALERVRSLVGECTAGRSDAARTVVRLQATLEKTGVERALDRLDRRRILRLVD
jgi:hypothetical protein